MQELKGKKLLVLGGAFQHCKIVRAAQKLGVTVYVTDYLKDSPAKQIADKSYMYNITDIDSIVALCKSEHIDGIITGYIDPCPRPYQLLCEKLGLPCYATKQEIFNLTDKHAFKKMCVDNYVDVIPEYPEAEFADGKEPLNVKYPLFVKPVDSRGSRGQTVCYNRDDVIKAIEFARSESSNGDVLIERFMGNQNEFQVTYFFINGKPYLLRTADRHLGGIEYGLEKVSVCTVSPSKHTELYISSAHNKVVKMFENLGIKNGPVFMQGFVDDDKFRFFDPGRRFPGSDFENIYKKIFQKDLMELLVTFALTGEMPEVKLDSNSAKLDGHYFALLFPTIKDGVITEINGLKELENNANFINIFPRYVLGDTVEMTYDIKQRFAEIDVLGKDKQDLISAIKKVQDALEIIDENGQNMCYAKFNTTLI